MKIKYLLISMTGVILTLSMLLTDSMAAEQDMQADMNRLQKLLRDQVSLMKPELQMKVKALSPETKKILLNILSQHTRYSDSLTLRQVMHEVLSDYQSMIAGIMTDNPKLTSSSALRIANHRIPVGGLLPYLGIENINDEKLATLKSFNDSVEGKAKELAASANNGDMGKASVLAGEMASGCVGCHMVFRGQPGISDLLK